MANFTASIKEFKKSTVVPLLPKPLVAALEDFESNSINKEYAVLHAFIEFRATALYTFIKQIPSIYLFNQEIKQAICTRYEYRQEDLIKEHFLLNEASLKDIAFAKYLLTRNKPQNLYIVNEDANKKHDAAQNSGARSIYNPQNIEKLKKHTSLFFLLKSLYLLTELHLLDQDIFDWISEEEDLQDKAFGIIALKSCDCLTPNFMRKFIKHYSPDLGKVLHYFAFANLTSKKDQKLLKKFETINIPHSFFQKKNTCPAIKKSPSNPTNIQPLQPTVQSSTEHCYIRDNSETIFKLPKEAVTKLANQLMILKVDLATRNLNKDELASLFEAVSKADKNGLQEEYTKSCWPPTQQVETLEHPQNNIFSDTLKAVEEEKESEPKYRHTN